MLARIWAQAFAAGAAAAAALLQLVIELLTEDEVSRLSSEWLDEITSTYMDLLAQALATGESHEDIEAVLKDQAHALLIATTELARGKAAGAYEAFKAKQVQYVRWVTTSHDPCPECLENEAAGRWPLGQPFPSGAIMPPDHPQCQCHLEPA